MEVVGGWDAKLRNCHVMPIRPLTLTAVHMFLLYISLLSLLLLVLFSILRS
jgi:hypothetical protein